jgi:hypothetical protein
MPWQISRPTGPVVRCAYGCKTTATDTSSDWWGLTDPAVHRTAQPTLYEFGVHHLDVHNRFEPRDARRKPKIVQWRRALARVRVRAVDWRSAFRGPNQRCRGKATAGDALPDENAASHSRAIPARSRQRRAGYQNTGATAVTPARAARGRETQARRRGVAGGRSIPPGRSRELTL